jgi:hypothetical protein
MGPAGKHVQVVEEVLEPLLCRADLLAQLLRIGWYTSDPQRKTEEPSRWVTGTDVLDL